MQHERSLHRQARVEPVSHCRVQALERPRSPEGRAMIAALLRLFRSLTIPFPELPHEDDVP